MFLIIKLMMDLNKNSLGCCSIIKLWFLFIICILIVQQIRLFTKSQHFWDFSIFLFVTVKVLTHKKLHLKVSWLLGYIVSWFRRAVPEHLFYSSLILFMAKNSLISIRKSYRLTLIGENKLRSETVFSFYSPYIVKSLFQYFFLPKKLKNKF